LLTGILISEGGDCALEVVPVPQSSQPPQAPLGLAAAAAPKLCAHRDIPKIRGALAAARLKLANNAVRSARGPKDMRA
jgi:hypothetical protein